MYTMPPELISTAYFVNPSHRSVSVYVFPLSLLDNGSVKKVTAATNTHETTELLNESFSMRSVSHRKKVGHQFFPELLVLP
jgi:hypothetical protein